MYRTLFAIKIRIVFVLVCCSFYVVVNFSVTKLINVELLCCFDFINLHAYCLSISSYKKSCYILYIFVCFHYICL